MAHTPGPWGIVFTGASTRIRLNGSTVYQVSDVTAPDFPSGQPRYCLDDLRLMAAAPEMLAALERALNRWDDEDEDDAPSLGAAMRAALAKAEGRTDVNEQ